MIKFCWLYILFCLPLICFSQSDSGALIQKGKILLPGATTSLAFVIKNNTLDSVHYQIHTNTSDQLITAILSEGDIEISPVNSGIYIVPIQIDKGTLAGKYKIFLDLKRMEKNASKSFPTNVRLEKTITIGPLRKISLTQIKAPTFSRAGDTIYTSFLLNNEGNTSEQFRLSSDARIVGKTDLIKLPPSSSKIIQVERYTTRDNTETQVIFSRLTAKLINDSSKMWNAYGNTTVYALNPKEKDAFFRFPVQASLSYVGIRERGIFDGGYQGEIFGKGSLSTKSKRILEFHAVTASPIRFNSYTKYEEYYVDYQNEHWYMHLGDKAYSASYLTEYYRYGRGAEIHYHLGRFTFGGFYNRPRFFGDIDQEYNVFTEFKLSHNTSITTGYLNKSPKDSSDEENYSAYKLKDRTSLPYLIVRSKFWQERIGVEAEVANSHSQLEDGMGYRLQLQGNYRGFNANAQMIRTTPDFNGYFKDANVFYGNLNYHKRKWNFSFNYNQDARNIQQDTLYLTAPLQKSYQLGLTYNYLKTGSLSVFSGSRKYEDRMEPKQFDYSEAFARLSVNQKLNIFSINAETEFAKTTNYLTGLTGKSNYYTLNLGADKNKISINLYGSYSNTTRYSADNQHIFYYGARSLWQIGNTSSLSVFYQNDYQPEEYYRNRNLLELQYKQRLFKQNFIEFSGRYTLQQGELYDKDYLFSIRYTAGINIPVKRIAEYVTVKGVVQNFGGSHVNGIKIYLGNHSTITDGLGNFIFKNIIPGDYTIDIDDNTLKMEDITTVSLPVLLKITNQPLIYNIGLTTAASVSGNVVVQNTHEDKKSASFSIDLDKKDEKDGFLIIEAKNGTETYRQICKLNSKFTFTHLRPGDWQFKIYQESLGRHYKVIQPEFKIMLKPGAKQALNIVVVKKETKVNFQQGDLQISYGNN